MDQDTTKATNGTLNSKRWQQLKAERDDLLPLIEATEAGYFNRPRFGQEQRHSDRQVIGANNLPDPVPAKAVKERTSRGRQK
jgi:hypothetical protein